MDLNAEELPCQLKDQDVISAAPQDVTPRSIVHNAQKPRRVKSNCILPCDKTVTYANSSFIPIVTHNGRFRIVVPRELVELCLSFLLSLIIRNWLDENWLIPLPGQPGITINTSIIGHYIVVRVFQQVFIFLFDVNISV